VAQNAFAQEAPPLPPPGAAPPAPPPPVYRPGPPATQFSPGAVDVSIEADKPGANLEALAQHPAWIAFHHRWHTHLLYGTTLSWVPICSAPCAIRVPADAVYRVAGPTVTASDGFVLRQRPGAARLRVEAGSRKAHTVGIVSLALGIPIAALGVILVAASDDTRSAGYLTGGIGLGLTLLGAILFATSNTTVYDEAGRAVGANTSRAPRVAF
jgi:hypothetical protein